tara:strand:- start:1244 stop:1417 length:174 start_codon:yes stop_codon:yes gene_type:complete
MSDIKQLIDNLAIDDNVSSAAIFNSTMKSKIMDAVETMKVEMGNSVYNGVVDSNEDI